MTAEVHPVFCLEHRGGLVAGVTADTPKSHNRLVLAQTISAALQSHVQSALNFARRLSALDPTVQGLPTTYPEGESPHCMSVLQYSVEVFVMSACSVTCDPSATMHHNLPSKACNRLCCIAGVCYSCASQLMRSCEVALTDCRWCTQSSHQLNP